MLIQNNAVIVGTPNGVSANGMSGYVYSGRAVARPYDNYTARLNG